MRYFSTGKNYMKHALRGSGTMNKPDTLSGGFYNSTAVISHNLGYVPLVRLFYDHDGDGTIYPANGQEGTQTAGPLLDYWFWADDITTTQVNIKAQSLDSQSGTFTYYYIIYYDQP